ncbi:MAG: hypothetical protein ABIH37_03530 [archaeon]
MEMQNISELEKLKQENKELKQALSVCLNKPLVKRLAEAMQRIDSGEYLTEEEFFKDSQKITA